MGCLLCVCQTVSVPVGSSVRGVEWVRTIGRNANGTGHQNKKQRNHHARILCFLHFLFTSKISVQRTRRSLFPLNARAVPCAKLILPGVTDAIWEPTRYSFHNHSKRSTALTLRLVWKYCITSFAPPLLRIQSHGLS